MCLSPEIYNKIGLSTFVALDLETTGLNAGAHEILEIGAARVESGRITQTFDRLVQIRGELSLQITHLTGICEQDLRNQPPIEELLPEIMDFVGDSPIMGHNIDFDMGFLDEKISTSSPLFQRENPLDRLQNPRLDTLLLARALLPRIKNHRLETLVQFFEIPVRNKHRALDDVQAEIRLFDALLRMLLSAPPGVLKQFVRIVAPLTDGTAHLIQRAFQLVQTGAEQVPGVPNQILQKIPRLNNIIGENAPSGARKEKEKMDEDEVAAIFDRGGLFNQVRSDFEKRGQQINMVRGVCRAFNEKAFFLAEAGTGTGKSLAYLVPSILWAQRHPLENGRVVVSTNTKNLQEQIFFKDLPFLFRHLPEPFRAVLLKGRNNYICIDRWKKFLADAQEEVMPAGERWELLPVVTWMDETVTGDIEENSGFHVQFHTELWSRLRADAHFCPGQRCPYFQQCFVTRARRAARQAELVVVNHSLLLSDLSANRSVLGEYPNLILDEAHNLEAAATKYLALELNRYTIERFLHQLYRFVGKEVGLLPLLRDQLHFSSIEESQKNTLLTIVYRLVQIAGQTEKSCGLFFGQLSEKSWEFNFAHRAALTAKIRYRKWEDVYGALGPAADDFIESLQSVRRDLSRLLENLLLLSETVFTNLEMFCSQTEGAKNQLQEILETFQRLLETPGDDFVYWCEPAASERKQESRLKAAPLRVASVLKNRLYEPLQTLILTSATLTVGEQFDYFKNRVGLSFVEPDRLLERTYDSPFYYDDQVLLAVPAFLPDPRDPHFVAAISGLVRRLISETRRGTLILFTSYEMLKRVYSIIQPLLEAEGILTLAQGKDGSRNSLVRIFQEEGSAVLLGTNSFWEGVDIPGKPLEILVLTKLPFEVPAEPVFQAWMEEIEKRGGNPFFQLSVPMAVLKFRQGFGRLIRTGSDRGMVLILDNRVLRFQYGKIFLESLPLEAAVFEEEETLLARAHRWFE